MDSDDNKEKEENKEKSNKPENETKIKKVGGIRGWLLRKAKTFMWDANSNTLVLPQGVSLTIEEETELRAMFGEITDQAKVVAQHREQMMSAQQQMGVRFKADVINGYSLLISGSYRELTGVLAHKIHDNLQGMLMVNNRFLSGLWKAISRSNDNKEKSPLLMKRGNDGR